MLHPLTIIMPNNDISVYFPIEAIEDEQDEIEIEETNIINIIYYRQMMHSLAIFVKMHSLIRGVNAIEATVVDRIDTMFRFNVIYCVQGFTTNNRYLLSTWASEELPIISLQNIYPAFNWSEREIWDMFGLFVIKHPDLRRLLTDYGFIGYPMRKDFPLTGFREVQYEDTVKLVEYSYTELLQSYRLLSFSNTWMVHE